MSRAPPYSVFLVSFHSLAIPSQLFVVVVGFLICYYYCYYGYYYCHYCYYYYFSFLSSPSSFFFLFLFYYSCTISTLWAEIFR